MIPQAGGVFRAIVPYLREIVTRGQTVEEALSNGKEETELALEELPVKTVGVVMAEIEVMTSVVAVVGENHGANEGGLSCRVVPPDPHGFDGDHDGIGCESG